MFDSIRRKVLRIEELGTSETGMPDSRSFSARDASTYSNPGMPYFSTSAGVTAT
jgi:hypothetical protein